MKIRLEETEVVPWARTDGQTDVTQTDIPPQLIVAFRNFTNAPSESLGRFITSLWNANVRLF